MVLSASSTVLTCDCGGPSAIGVHVGERVRVRVRVVCVSCARVRAANVNLPPLG